MSEHDTISAAYNAIRPRTAQWLQAQIEYHELTLALPDTYYVLPDGGIAGGKSHKRAAAALVELRAELERLEGQS